MNLDFVILFALTFPLFMMAVVVHEVSHGWVALTLGDTTALDAGRLTLNPFKHIDPVGTILLPLMLMMLRLPAFGWAKPVPVNPLRFKHPKQGMVWVGVAGPIANFILAGVAALFVHALPLGEDSLWVQVGTMLVIINLLLGLFNLLPIPPLDGSRVLVGILPAQYARGFLKMERWGFPILVALIYLGFVRKVLFPAVEWMAGLLGIAIGA